MQVEMVRIYISEVVRVDIWNRFAKDDESGLVDTNYRPSNRGLANQIGASSRLWGSWFLQALRDEMLHSWPGKECSRACRSKCKRLLKLLKVVGE